MTLPSIAYDNYFSAGITYQQYLANFQAEIELGDKSPFAKYLPQNWSRQSRLDRKLKLSEDVLFAMDALETTVKWLVITEHWCGDASQINAVIHQMALASKGKIELRFTYRDQNIELIDAHLTDGRSRSIPIVLQLDLDYNLAGTYGPRPAEAQKVVKSLIAKGEAYDLPLHTWYARDKQKSIQNDLVELLRSAK